MGNVVSQSKQKHTISNTMAKDTNSILMMVLGLIVSVTATVTFGLVDIEILNKAIKPIAAWVYVGGFAGVYLLSDRQVNQLKDFEAVALIVPIITAIAIQEVSEVSNLLTEFKPIAGFVFVGVTLIGNRIGARCYSRSNR